MGGRSIVTIAGGGDVVQRMEIAFQGRRQVHPERGRRGRGRRRGRQGGRQVVAGAAACGSRTRKRRTEHTTARRAGRKSAQRNRFLLFFFFDFFVVWFWFLVFRFYNRQRERDIVGVGGEGGVKVSV